MFTLENIIGDIVFVSLRDKSFLSKIAIPEDLNHFKIMGQDQLGLWVEHPQLTFKYKLDKNGDSIPKNEQKTEKVAKYVKLECYQKSIEIFLKI